MLSSNRVRNTSKTWGLTPATLGSAPPGRKCAGARRVGGVGGWADLSRPGTRLFAI